MTTLLKPTMKKTLLLLVTAALTSGVAIAQTGRYDVQLVQKTLDCAKRKIQVEVAVRATDAAGIFRMGDANYRFRYSPAMVKQPMLVQEQTFTNATAGYAGQTLTGSLETANAGIVSLNTFYVGDGQNARLVSTDWTPVATLEFDLVNTTATTPLEMAWQSDQVFPKTSLGGVEPGVSGFATYTVKASGRFMNYVLASPAAACLTANNVTTPTAVSVVTSAAAGLPAPTATISAVSVSSAEVLSAEDVFVPEGFSPNGDRVNDRFVIRAGDKQQVSLFVYNRWGTIVYQKEDYQNDWEGKNTQGRDLPDGTYFYQIQLENGQKITRYVTISR
jgi:gliding motility-associated-like protein